MNKMLGIISLVAVFSFSWVSVFHTAAHANDAMILAQNSDFRSQSIEIVPGKNSSSRSLNAMVKNKIIMNLMKNGFGNIVASQASMGRSKTPPNVSPLPALAATQADIPPSEADIVVMFDINIRSNGSKAVSSLAIKAIESSTGTILASETANGKVYSAKMVGAQNSSIEDAVNSAMPHFIKQLKESLQHKAASGSSYKISFLKPPKDLIFKIRDILSSACKRVKVEASSQNMLSFRVRCKKNSLDMADIIDRGLRKKLPKTKFNFLVKNRNMITVEFK